MIESQCTVRSHRNRSIRQGSLITKIVDNQRFLFLLRNPHPHHQIFFDKLLFLHLWHSKAGKYQTCVSITKMYLNSNSNLPLFVFLLFYFDWGRLSSYTSHLFLLFIPSFEINTNIFSYLALVCIRTADSRKIAVRQLPVVNIPPPPNISRPCSFLPWIHQTSPSLLSALAPMNRKCTISQPHCIST